MTRKPPEDPDPRCADNGLTMVGWREWLALPQLGLPAIKAKVDTGARTSALHAFHAERFSSGGRSLVRFGVHPLQRLQVPAVACTAPLLDERVVSDSGGHRERRWVIETEIRLGELAWSAEVTLTDRDSMLFRMLLGRTAMAGRLAVDPQGSFLASRRPDLSSLYPSIAGEHPRGET